MQQVGTRRIEPGMDIIDSDGQKLGSVALVYRPAVGAEIIELRTGFMGMGQRLYIQGESIREIGAGKAGFWTSSRGTVTLSKSRGELEKLGWDRKPEALTRPH